MVGENFRRGCLRPARLLAPLVSNHLHRCVVGWALVGHQDFRFAIAFHCFSPEFLRCGLVALFGDLRFEHLPFVVHSAPEVVRFTANLQKHFVQVPAPLLDPAHRLGSPITDLFCELAAEVIYPEAEAVVANIYAPYVQKPSTFINENGNRTHNNTPG
jgi:hypothetical protein